MGPLLLLIFLLTLAYLGYFVMPGARRSDAYALGRKVTAGYLSLSSLLIVALVVSYLGYPGAKVQKLVRHLEFRGIAVTVPSISGDTSNVRITSNQVDSDSEVKRAFRWPALPAEAWIDLRPDRTEGKSIASYRAEAHQCPQVVRLNRVCVNDTVGGWIPVGNKVTFLREASPVSGAVQRLSMTHEMGSGFTIRVESGSVSIGSDSDKTGGTSIPLLDRISLRDVVSQTARGDRLRALSDRDDFGESILDKVEIVRYRRRDGDSAVGVVCRGGPPVGAQDSPDSTDTYYTILADRQTPASAVASNQESVEASDGRFRLDVFGTDSRSTLILPGESKPAEGGHAQLQFLFDPPRAYPLPPDDLLLSRDHTVQLASADLGQDGNGYLFDTGNLNEGFLATATLTQDGSSMTLGSNASDAGSLVPVNENQVLGNGSVAPIFALADPLRSTHLPWLLPVAGVLLGLIFCLGSMGRIPWIKATRRLPVNVAPAHAAFVLWVVSASILAVRCVLAFRVSMLPPFNMDAVSAVTFRGAWPKAWLPALVFPPLIGLLTYFVVRAKQPGARQPRMEELGEWATERLKWISNRPWGFLSRSAYSLAFMLAVLMLVQKVIHFAFPDVVLIGVLLVILGLVFDGIGEAKDDELAEQSATEKTAQTRLGEFAARYKWIRNLLSKRYLWSRNPMLWGASILLLFLDPGTFLFFVPLGIALCLGTVIAGTGQRAATADPKVSSKAVVGRVGLFTIVGVIVFGIVFSAPIGVRLLTNPVAAKVLKNAAFPYRLAATNVAASDGLLVDPETKRGPFLPHRMQETLHQRWQMISYLRANGLGYFSAPLSNVGMTYPTTLSDAAFSVYLVAEHGNLAGTMVIGLLLLLAMALMRAAWVAGSSRNQKANARGLYAIGGVFGFAAVYMALANLWVIPFTGQNVPFLSLNSWKDLILNGTLLVAAVLLIAYPGSWSAQPDPMVRRDARRNIVAWTAMPALLTLGLVFLVIALMGAGGDPAEPFNLSPSTLTTVQHAVEDARQQAGLKQIPLEKTTAIQGAGTFVRSLVAGFDSGEVTKTPIVEARGAGLTVDKRFFLLRSPYEKDAGVAWHGSVLAQGIVSRRQLVVGGSRVPILMEPGAGPGQLILGRPIRQMIAQSIDIKQVDDHGRGRKTIDYGGIKLDGDRILLRWKDFGKPGAILVNGKRPDLKFNELEIHESDIVSLEYTGADEVPQKLSIQYLGPTQAKLASVVWRNGKYTRTYPQGADFPLAYTIGEIGDEVARTSPTGQFGQRQSADKLLKRDLEVSVDMVLQRELQNELKQWARERSRLIDRGAPMPDGLPFTAVSVLDSTTGQIRALASIPNCDPREDFGKVESRFSSESDAQIAARSSWTLVNRTIGSTIKPLGFSALNSQLDSKSFDLTKLHVNEEAGVESYVDKEGRERRAYRRLGDIHLKQGKGLGSKENPRPDVDMITYLRDSRTWPAIVTSTIGLVSDKGHPAAMRSELANMLSPGAGPVSMGGERMAFTPGRTLKRLFSNPTTVSSIELADTAYFKGIEQCYGPSVVPFNTNEVNRWDDGLEKQFYAPLDLSKVSKQNLKNLGLPEVHWADTTNLTDLDGQLIRYMIGGGECRWNAVTMATNFARITTGKKIQPTLSALAKPTKDSMPAPLDSAVWRKAHLLTPLLEITTIPAEDVTVIRSTVAKAGYRIAMKTGTIDDGMGDKAMESEMLMFTVGKYNDATGFVPGQCISGFFSIRSAKKAEGDVMIKGDLIKRVMPILVGYLRRSLK